MSSSDRRPLFPENMKQLCFGEEQPRNTEPSAAVGGKRGRKPGSSKTPKNKVPQRGMGVERLEQIRVQESLQQAAAAGLVVLPPPPQPQPQTPPTLVHHHHHHSTPLGYGAPSPQPHAAYGGYGLDQFPKPIIHAGHSSISSTFGGLVHRHQGPNFTTEGVAVAATSPGWPVSNHHHHQPNRVGPFGSGAPFGGGSPMETSKELSSIPNLLTAARSESFPSGHMENVFYPDSARGSIVWRGRPDSEPKIRVAEDGTYYREEPAELIAVHQNGSSEVMMEYEFFPGKYGRGTVPKELEFPTLGSGSAGGEAGSSIVTTVAADYGDTASNSLDLSLKLYH